MRPARRTELGGVASAIVAVTLALLITALLVLVFAVMWLAPELTFLSDVREHVIRTDGEPLPAMVQLAVRLSAMAERYIVLAWMLPVPLTVVFLVLARASRQALTWGVYVLAGAGVTLLLAACGLSLVGVEYFA